MRQTRFFTLVPFVVLALRALATTILYTYPQNVEPKYIVKGANVSGFCHDVIAELNARLSRHGIQIAYRSLAKHHITDIAKALKKGNIQIFVGIGILPDLESVVRYVEFPIFGVREALLIRRGERERFLSGRLLSIGTLAGTLPARSAGRIFENLVRVEFNDPVKAINALEKKTVDGVYTADFLAWYYAKRAPEKFEVINTFNTKFYMYVALAMNVRDETFQRVREAVLQIYSAGSLEKISAKYGLSEHLLPGNLVQILLVDWKPYEWYEEREGRWKGFDVETVEAVFKRLGFKVSFHTYPWLRCLELLKTQAFDGAISVARFPGRDEFLVFPDEPLSTGVDVLFKLKDKAVDFNSLEKVPKDVICGYSPGYAYGSWFWNAPFKREPVPSDSSGFVMLSRGKIDLFVCNLLVGKALLKEMQLEERVEHSRPFGETMLYYATFTNNHHGRFLSKLFSDELRRFKMTDNYRKILGRYGLKYDDLWR